MLRAALAKELRLLLRDRGTLVSLFVLPIAFMGFFGVIFTQMDANATNRIAVVSEVAGADVRGRARERAVRVALSSGGQVHLRPAGSRLDMMDAIRRRDVDAGLLFPAEFGDGVRPELFVDAARPAAVRAPFETAMAAMIASAGAPECRASIAGAVITRDVSGARAELGKSGGFQTSVPANIVLFTFFIAVTMGISFIEERRSGTWQRLRACPVSTATLLTAKLVPFFVIGLLQVAFLLAVGIGVFGMTIAGSLAAVVVLSASMVLCAVTLGLLVASFGGSEKAVGGVVSVLLLILGMLGGAMVPREIMPEALAHVGALTPHGLALDGLRALVLRAGTSVTDVVAPTLGLLGFSAGFALLGLGRMVRR
jgi:ABC-2 type transport system permease protein